MEHKTILQEKSYSFALRIIKLSHYLKDKNEHILNKQILRSGTSIGALIREAEFAQSKPDFINKLSISLKEANETVYWINLLKDSNYINDKMYKSIEKDNQEIIKILVSSINTLKKEIKK